MTQSVRRAVRSPAGDAVSRREQQTLGQPRDSLCQHTVPWTLPASAAPISQLWFSLGRRWSILLALGCCSKHTSQRQERSSDRFPAVGWWWGVIIKNYGAMQCQRYCRCFQDKAEWLQTGNCAVFSCQKTFAILSPSFTLTGQISLSTQICTCSPQELWELHCRSSLSLPGRSRGWAPTAGGRWSAGFWRL